MSKMTPQQKAAQTRRENREKAAKEKAAQQAAKEKAAKEKAPEGKVTFPPIMWNPPAVPGGARPSMNGLSFKTFALVETMRQMLNGEQPTYESVVAACVAKGAPVTASRQSYVGWCAWWRKNASGSGIPTGCKVVPIHVGAHVKDGAFDEQGARKAFATVYASIRDRAYPVKQS